MYPSCLPSWSSSLSILLVFSPLVNAVTLYNNHGAITSTVTAANATYTGMEAYNPTTLTPPPLPSPAPPNAFNIALTAAPPTGLSIKHNGSFFGFSIEFSVLNQVLGTSSSVLQVPFLNLMANIRDRAGAIHIRVGGNTQETATLVDSLPNNELLQKELSDLDNPTHTPALDFTVDVIYMMANISALVNVYWYMGVPFNDTSNWRLQIAEKGDAILGKYLVGLQAGNEPDLYAKHGHRPADYSPADYGDDFGLLVKAIAADPLITRPDMLIGPNLAGTWTPEMVWNTGFATTYAADLGALAVERYPTDNCFARYGYGDYHDPQQEIATYLTHNSAQSILKEYSCGGFPGISDAYGASLWALDYAMQLAYSNFSFAMFHSSGQNVSYNPFTPPPTKEAYYHQWTIGPVYYAALVMAEFLGSSNVAQIIDLFPAPAQQYTPAYAAYENGNMVRLALFNYMDDSTGASDYTATVSVGGKQTGEAAVTPASVQVKYLSAASVAQKGNITWANQTFGGYYESDGRLMGTEYVETVQCDQGANTCQIKVPAPGFALVFFTNTALSESDNNNGAQQTFATTVQTRTVNTATVAPGMLATSNGGRGRSNFKGSTSPEKTNAGGSTMMLPGLMALIGAAFGALLIGRAL